ncbi:MAG: DUF4349 domain-containing protein [Candidatus Acidiferrales bacterium]
MKSTTHAVAPEEVMAYLDGELSPAGAQTVGAHVAQCAECANLAEKFRSTSESLSRWNVEAIPAKVENSVVELTAKTRSGLRIGHAIDFIRTSFWTWKQWAAWLGATAGVLVLIVAIVTPNLMRSKMAANEASAVASLRVLNTALVSYSGAYGHYPFLLRSLGPPQTGNVNEDAAGLVDPLLAGGRKAGYVFTYRTMPGEGRYDRSGYTIKADPIDPNSTGHRGFSTDQTLVIRTDGGEVLDGGYSQRSWERGMGGIGEHETVQSQAEIAPMIARTAELKLVVERFDEARNGMNGILLRHNGYIGQLSASSESGSARTLSASLRVPAGELDACLDELRKLGRVTQESQAGEEVTRQHLDLVARLNNSRHTEARLADVLQKHGSQTKDILEVEKESARVRAEIEQMEAEQKTLEHRVEFATVNLQLTEEYKAELGAPAASVSNGIHNAMVAGYRNASDTILGIVLFSMEYGPSLVIWLLILLLPVVFVWRRYRKTLATV